MSLVHQVQAFEVPRGGEVGGVQFVLVGFLGRRALREYSTFCFFLGAR